MGERKGLGMTSASAFRYCPVCAAALVLHPDTDAGKVRLMCPDGHWTHWDNPVPVVAALVEIDGRFLLARNASWPEDWYGLIAGYLERDESPEEGIARELREETNLDAQRVELIGVYEFLRKNELLIVYYVRAQGEIRLSHELVDYRLLPAEALRPWPAGTGHGVADWLRRQGLPVQYVSYPGSTECIPTPPLSREKWLP